MTRLDEETPIDEYRAVRHELDEIATEQGFGSKTTRYYWVCSCGESAHGFELTERSARAKHRDHQSEKLGLS